MKKQNEILSVVLPMGLKEAFRAKAKEAGYLDGSEYLRALIREIAEEPS